LLIGKPGEAHAKIAQRIGAAGSEDAVVCPGYLEDDALSEAYAGCAFLLFPSLYEGFGFPILEAMSRGKTLIASNRGSMSEVVGQAGILLDPEDREAWVEAMIRLWQEDERRAGLERAASQRAQEFGWERTGRMAWEALDRVGGRHA
jgi:glycosyltransferase involved in cell wall biosynthesis